MDTSDPLLPMLGALKAQRTGGLLLARTGLSWWRGWKGCPSTAAAI